MRTRRWIVLSLSLAVLLGACGGSGAPQTTTTQATNQPVTAPAFPAGTYLDRVQKSGRLRVGVPFNQPGFGSKQGAAKVPEGFDVEMARLIAQGIFGGLASEADQHIEYIETVSTNRESFLQTEKVDIVAAAYPITPARLEQVDFAGPYYVSHGEVLVKSDSPIRVIGDLNGLNVCMRSGSSLITPLQSKAPQANVVPADTYAQCMQRLNDGTAKAVVSDDVVLAGLAQSSNGTARTIGARFTDDPYGIGVKKGNAQLQEFVGSRLRVIENTQDWQRAFTSTLGSLGLATPEPPRVVYPPTTTTATAPTSTSGTSTTSPQLTSSGQSPQTTVPSGTTVKPG